MINKFKKIVIKIGSSSIIDEKTKKVRIKWLNSLCKDISALIKENKKIAIVSSGAIALGKNFMDNYNIVQDEIVKYGKNLNEKIELVALSKSDLISDQKKDLVEMIEKKIGKKPYIFSCVTNDGIENLIKVLFEQCLNNND